MISNRSLHRIFVSSRNTPLFLLVVSLAFILPAIIVPSPVVQHPFMAVGDVLATPFTKVLSVLIYAVAAFVMSLQNFFENRVRWMAMVFIWLVAISVFPLDNCWVALSVLLYVVSFSVLLLSQNTAASVQVIYTAFALVGFASLLTPLFLYLIPPFLLFSFYTQVVSPRGLTAAILGIATPYWLLFGGEYVFPGLQCITEPFLSALDNVFSFALPHLNLADILLLAISLTVLLSAVAIFFGRTSLAKPLLRRRISYLMWQNLYLILLACFVKQAWPVLYSWSLPAQAVLLAFVFSGKPTKVSNICFVLTCIYMLAVAVYSLWVRF